MPRPDSQRVVITGMGVVSPNGIGTETFARACLAGITGIRPIDGIDTSALKTWAAGQVIGFDPTTTMPTAELRRVPPMVPMALAASREALDQAGLTVSESDIAAGRRIGVALGTGGGGLSFVEDQYRNYFTRGVPSLYSITAGTHGNLSSELSIALHLRGPSHVISTGCTSSTDAIGYAAMLIRNGVVPAMLAGGADTPIAAGILSAFEKMRVISTRRWPQPHQASRPFSADRDGFILGEGAWMFVLESADRAAARGAAALAEIAGYGSTCDAYHRVQIAPDLDEPVRAMELAMADAELEPPQIGYANLHGTGTELNDRLESAAVRRYFADHANRLACNSTKSMIGHPQGACGAAGLAATIIQMRAGRIHPTLNLDHPDPACDLDYTPHTSRPLTFDAALSNCIAFGSKNSALVIRRT
jgi:3-oxoacyl-[acyl-carrier-protein] synthase II